MMLLRSLVSSCVALALLGRSVTAQCTTVDPMTLTQDQLDRGIGAQAICVLEATDVDELEDIDDALTGYFRFVVQEGASATDDTMCVEYNIENIADGTHGFHVHTYGSLHSTNASATGGHFFGDCSPLSVCRPNAAVDLQMEVGLLNDGVGLVADMGVASGTFDDTLIKFSGVNSIIGRSVVVHGLTSSERIAQCVIGRNDAEDTYATTAVNNVDGVTQADCVLSTSDHAVSSSGQETGYLRFTQRGEVDGLTVELWVTDFENDGLHQFHVHQIGNLLNDSSTGMHFVGNVDFLSVPRVNVGGLSPTDDLNTGVAANSIAGEAHYAGSWEFTDAYASLSGRNSIIGRPVVIHDESEVEDRIAHCVVGILEEGAPVEAADTTTSETPKVLVAQTVLLPTQVDGTSSGVHGTVEFAAEDGSNNVHVRYFFTGLSPGEHGWHVHTFGDISSDDASATSGHFVGTCAEQDPPCRVGVEEIGSIGNDHMLAANEFGEAYGEFEDDVLRLNGVDSIVGRSVVVHGNADGTSVRVAQGVIGRSLDSVDQMAENQNPISSLRCDIAPTNVDADFNAAGYVRFFRSEANEAVMVQYNITGLSEGDHAWHVHHAGNLLSNQDGASTEGHFIGVPLPGRSGGLDEVGALNDNTAITADADGAASGSFVDTFLEFHDAYSIVGRSMVIHATPTGGAREAYCVIGIESEFALTTPAPVPAPTSTTATPEATESVAPVAATFSFVVVPMCSVLAALLA